MSIQRSVIKTSMIKSGLLVFLQLAIVNPSQGGDQCTDQLPLNNCWETKNIIDERIDVHAQKALIKMFNNDGPQASSASAILCAVKRGDLDGIYLEDQRVPALRARDAGSGWWKILNGKESVCYKTPDNKKPIIVLSNKIVGNIDNVSSQMSASWNDCNIRSSEKRCYKQTIGSGGATVPRECDINRDCEVKYGPNYECDMLKKVCVYKFGMEVTPHPCTGQGECKMDWDCASNNCIRPDQNKCGRCRSLNPERYSKEVCADGEEWGACLVNSLYFSCEKIIDIAAQNEAKSNLEHVLKEEKEGIIKQYINKAIEFTVRGNASSRVSIVVEKEYDTGRTTSPWGGQTVRMKQLRIKNRECVTLGYEIN